MVTVGMHNQGFDRLVKAMDELARQLAEQVIIQFGSASYHPYFAESFQWTTSWQMEQLIAEARVIVTHAAAGTIILGLKYRKPLVVVPRLEKFGEVFDDHQIQLAKALSVHSRVIAVEQPTVESLRTAIEVAGRLPMSPVGSRQLVEALRNRLAELEIAGSGKTLLDS
ncbi:MAG: glycosyltransferase [Omnitrophica WOR_2 bacterium]